MSGVEGASDVPGLGGCVRAVHGSLLGAPRARAGGRCRNRGRTDGARRRLRDGRPDERARPQARRRTRLRHRPVRAVRRGAARGAIPASTCGSARRNRFRSRDSRFDAAVAQLVLHFVTDPTAAARELRRVVRTGGQWSPPVSGTSRAGCRCCGSSGMPRWPSTRRRRTRPRSQVRPRRRAGASCSPSQAWRDVATRSARRRGAIRELRRLLGAVPARLRPGGRVLRLARSRAPGPAPGRAGVRAGSPERAVHAVRARLVRAWPRLAAKAPSAEARPGYVRAASTPPRASTRSRSAPVPISATSTSSSRSTNSTYRARGPGQVGDRLDARRAARPSPAASRRRARAWWKSLWWAGNSSVSAPSRSR